MQAAGYPFNWAEIAAIVKDQAGGCCEECHRPHDPLHGYTLTTHHIDADPSNCARWNLVALCQRCHLHFQSLFVPGQIWMFDAPAWYLPYMKAQLKLTNERN